MIAFGLGLPGGLKVIAATVPRPMRRLRINLFTLFLWCVAVGLALTIAARLVVAGV